MPEGAGASIGNAPFEARELRAALARIEPLAAAQPDRVRVVRAPGRVNLIGEHTDYNEGFVLPAAIDLEIRLALVPSGDRRVEITLSESGERASFDLDRVGPPGSGAWIDYVAGTAWALAEAEAPLRGFRGLLSSTLPMSAGLSSSAALELAAAWALTAPPGGGLDGMSLARHCQRAENAYVGVNCGLMDQAAVQLCEPGAAMLLDCRSLTWRSVALPLERFRLVVCDTGSPRRLGASQYNERRARCETAARTISEEHREVESLRDVTPRMLAAARERLDPETYRRAEHVVLENERTLAAVEALEADDMDSVGRLFAESHRSLRDLFEVSSPELDALVEIVAAVPGVAATRMTGAGFGGCTVTFVERDAVERLRSAVLAEYPARTGLRPRVFAVETAGGAGPMDAPL